MKDPDWAKNNYPDLFFSCRPYPSPEDENLMNGWEMAIYGCLPDGREVNSVVNGGKSQQEAWETAKTFLEAF